MSPPIQPRHSCIHQSVRLAVLCGMLVFIMSSGDIRAELPPESQNAVNLGNLAFKQNHDYLRAIRYYQQARKIAPDAPEIKYKLGVAESSIPGRELRAAIWFEAYLAASPNTPNAGPVRAEVERLNGISHQKLAMLINLLEFETGQMPGGVYDTLVSGMNNDSVIASNWGNIVELWRMTGNLRAAANAATHATVPKTELSERFPLADLYGWLGLPDVAQNPSFETDILRKALISKISLVYANDVVEMESVGFLKELKPSDNPNILYNETFDWVREYAIGQEAFDAILASTPTGDSIVRALSAYISEALKKLPAYQTLTRLYDLNKDNDAWLKSEQGMTVARLQRLIRSDAAAITLGGTKDVATVDYSVAGAKVTDNIRANDLKSDPSYFAAVANLIAQSITQTPQVKKFLDGLPAAGSAATLPEPVREDAGSAPETARKALVSCGMSNAKQLVLGCMAYATDHNDTPPRQLGDIVPAAMTAEQFKQVSIDPLSQGGSTFLYLVGETKTWPTASNVPVIVSRGVTQEGKSIVAYGDGHIQLDVYPKL